MTNNEKFSKILAEKGLEITHFIRYVYVVENDKEGILITYKTEPADVGNVYVGWHILSEVYWGIDWDEDDLIESAKFSINQFTNIPIDKLGLIDVFAATPQGQKDALLTLVFYTKIEDSSTFNFWFEYDDEALWLDKYEAIKQVHFEEDKNILRGFISDGLKPALLGFPADEPEEKNDYIYIPDDGIPKVDTYNYFLFPCTQAVAIWTNFYLGWHDNAFCAYPVSWQTLSEDPKYSTLFPLLEKNLRQYPNFKTEEAVFFLVFNHICQAEAGYIPAEEVSHNGVGDIKKQYFSWKFLFLPSTKFYRRTGRKNRI